MFFDTCRKCRLKIWLAGASEGAAPVLAFFPIVAGVFTILGALLLEGAVSIVVGLLFVGVWYWGRRKVDEYIALVKPS